LQQTFSKLRREKTNNRGDANQLHKDVGAMVRRTIKEIGGTMPENLPAAEGINKAVTRLKKGADIKKLPTNNIKPKNI
jgi:DNA-damage-inducible protein D